MLRATRLLHLCVISFGLGASAAAAQSTQPPSAGLLKRLAEAVDGHRTGAAVFVVVAGTSPHEVQGVFESRADADSLLRRLGQGFALHGPFQTERDPGQAMLVMTCTHDWASIWRMPTCPRTRPGLPRISFPDVDSISITLRLRNGTTQVIPLARGTDAVFLTLSAIDKFVIPYYGKIGGIDQAARMRAQIVAGLTAP